MAKNKNIQKTERESLNIKDKLFDTLKASIPEVFAEGKVNWDKLRRALGEHLETAADKFNFTWAGKASAITNVLIPSKATLHPNKKEGVKFDESENLFIEGDNLEVLKLLQKSYFEQIKMIYIDPPYNTGNDFVYHDDFKSPLKNYLEQSGQVDVEGNHFSTNTQASGRFHSDWLKMMYPRLKLAWNLLKHDGVIFISINDTEAYHLRMLMDEIFGEENFIAQLVWENKEGGGGSDSKYFRIKHEYIICYSKNKENALIRGVDISNEDRYTQKDKYFAKRGPYYLQKLNQASIQYSKSLDYSISAPDGKQLWPAQGEKRACWRWSKDKLAWGIKQGFIEFKKDHAETWQVYTKQYLNVDNEDQVIERKNRPLGVIENFSSTQGSKQLEELIGPKIFSYPKPIELIVYLMSLIELKDEVILDFFAGSGTTAHAVLVQNQQDGGNRKFIMVQMPEPIDSESEASKAGYKTIADIAKERIRSVIKGYGDHKPVDDGFKVFKLGESNYYDNLFEYDPDKSMEENDKAFKDYLNKAKKELFSAEVNELDVVYENIIKEGLSLNSKIDEIKIGKNKVYKVTDGEREFFISPDEKITESAIETLTGKEYKEKIFICFDGALNDSGKANLALKLMLKTI